MDGFHIVKKKKSVDFTISLFSLLFNTKYKQEK